MATVMDREHYLLVKQKYEGSKGDSTELFRAILSLAEASGMDALLACLERCVIEKRLQWLDRHLSVLPRSGNPLIDGYRIFYESYLGLSLPEDGQIVEATDDCLVTRWWNTCPTLEACKTLGLDTREVCRKAYHRPVEVFLSKIDPRLTFRRNYDALRPYAPYCEETIAIEP
jgi:hypothetical protein